MLVYIAGKYTGTKKEIKENIGIAREIAIRLAENKIPFICPHLNMQHFEEVKELESLNNQDFIDMDKVLLSKCDVLFLLHNWKESEGAVQEAEYARTLDIVTYTDIARLIIDIDILDKHKKSDRVEFIHIDDTEEEKQHPFIHKDPKFGMFDRETTDAIPNILQEADELTSGDRNQDYGHPKDDFRCTSDMFNTYMNNKYYDKGKRIRLEPEDHAIYMILTKISRQANKPKRDNLVDIAGYTKLLAVLCGFEEL